MRDLQDFISEESKMGKTYITVKATENADENAFQTILYAKPPFLPPITASEINGERIFSYDVGADGFKRLADLSANPSPADFTVIMKNLTEAVVQCRDYLLDPLNFLIDEAYTFVNPENYAARLIYLPFYDPVFSENDINRQVYSLARNLSRKFSANALSSEWQDIIAHLWNMPENITVYEAHKLYAGLCGKRKAVKPERQMAPPPPPPVQSPPQPQQAPKAPIAMQAEAKPKKSGLFGGGKKPETPKPEAPKPEAPKSGIFGKKPKAQPAGSVFGKKPEEPAKSGLFGKKEPAKPEIKKPEKPKKGGLFGSRKKPEVKETPTAGEFTVLLDDGMDKTEVADSQATLYVLEQGSRTVRIPIEKNMLVLGRNRNEVDYCFDSEGDRQISRVHAAINVDGDEYYLTDRQSSGGTFLDGRRLESGESVKIESGAVIRIGRRELLFELV